MSDANETGLGAGVDDWAANESGLRSIGSVGAVRRKLGRGRLGPATGVSVSSGRLSKLLATLATLVRRPSDAKGTGIDTRRSRMSFGSGGAAT